MGSTKPRLGAAQLEILQYIVDHHPIRVADVASHFASTSGKARTTVLTVMEKLREKGYLTRVKRQGAYHYSPRVSKENLMTSVVRYFVSETLGGSVSPLLAYLADSHNLTRDEIAHLRQLVSDLEQSRKGQS